MIVVDTSVFVAIILAEAEEAAFTAQLVTASSVAMSAGNYLECAMIAEGRGLSGRIDLDAWIARYGISVAPVDLPLAQLAADAFARFGKGRHPAALNHGDCFAYALARHLDAPLLFKGDDFSRTDIRSALAA